MSIRGNEDIDAVIEAALSNEPFRRAPITLHRRVEERLRLVALRAQQQYRFRYSMLTLAVAFLGALGLAGLAVSFTNLDVLISHGVAGGKGQYDYLTTTMALSWTGYSGAYSLLSSLFLAIGTMVLGLIPLRKYLSTH